MNTQTRQSWRSILSEIKSRIQEGKWSPGELIPKEAELADEFKCARTTVNRALRQLADDGLLERRRKGGTRVVTHPVRVAKLDIPVIRQIIEEQGGRYRHEILNNTFIKATPRVQKHLSVPSGTDVLQLNTLYFSNNKPFAYETRWVNISQVPDIVNINLKEISANEWLVNNTPLSNCDIHFSAKNAAPKEAKLLKVETGKAILVLDRTTWLGEQAITYVRICFTPKYQLITTL